MAAPCYETRDRTEAYVPKEVDMDFNELYELHHRRVRCICFGAMGNDQDVEDVVQKVFLQVFKKRDQFRGASAFTTWLHRLTMNEINMHRRALRRRDRWIHKHVSLLERMSFAPHPQIALRVALDRAIESLPPGMKRIFRLHEIEGYEHEEIGQMLGRSPGTSKSQLHKALLKLRAALS